MSKLFNKRLIELRKYNNLTQQKLADILDIKRVTLGSYEEYRVDIPYKLIPEIFELFELPKENLYDILFTEELDFNKILNQKHECKKQSERNY